MPFESEAQRRFLYAKHPEIAKKFAAHNTSEYKKLPEHKKEAVRRRIKRKYSEKGGKY